MQKTDAHQHFWKYNSDARGWITDDMNVLRRDFMPADLKKGWMSGRDMSKEKNVR
ncbi:MAG TPA: hypothetical protein VK112_05595 [Fodinibius sp.]|nr:hypothetical protein [Fodinibius sp.]